MCRRRRSSNQSKMVLLPFVVTPRRAHKELDSVRGCAGKFFLIHIYRLNSIKCAVVAYHVVEVTQMNEIARSKHAHTVRAFPKHRIFEKCWVESARA